MKKLALALSLAGSLLAATPYHVAVATVDEPDALLGAESLVQAYGDAAHGGRIQALVMRDWDEDRNGYVAALAKLAEDPQMKAVVVYQAVPGTAEAFKRIHARRPDIYCLAGDAHEDPAVITAAADLVQNEDFLSRGYTLVWAAKAMGARTFVHISFPRHLAQESLGRRRAIMEEVCRDLGLRFAAETSLDPLDVGGAQSRQFILGKVPEWLKQYGGNGDKVAFFCTQDGQTGPLLQRLLESKNGLFVEADLPSPLMGYPEALGLDLSGEKAFPAILEKVERAVVAKGGAGRFGTWAFSYGHAVTAGLGEYAIRVLDGKARKNSLEDLYAAFGKWTPGAKWNGALYVDAAGRQYPNLALGYMDTYLLGGSGQGHYLGTTSLKIPGKYYALKK